MNSSPLSYLPADTESLLDIGCNVGALLAHARGLGISRLHGVEINEEAASAAKASLGVGAQIWQGSADHLPFASDSIDAVICSEVLEHVPPELRPAVIREAARVLRPGGRLVLTVPHRGAFAFLDPANARFHFPGLYARLSSSLGGKGREAGFVGQKHGVVWHHHFTVRELESLAGNGFERRLIRFRGCLLVPFFEWLLFPLYRRGLYRHPIFRFAKWLQDLEMRWSFGAWLGYNVLCVWEKPVGVSASSAALGVRRTVQRKTGSVNSRSC